MYYKIGRHFSYLRTRTNFLVNFFEILHGCFLAHLSCRKATRLLYQLVHPSFSNLFKIYKCKRFVYVKDLHREILYTCKCITPFQNFLLFSTITQNRPLSGFIVGGSKKANFFTQIFFFGKNIFSIKIFFSQIFFVLAKKRKKIH